MSGAFVWTLLSDQVQDRGWLLMSSYSHKAKRKHLGEQVYLRFRFGTKIAEQHFISKFSMNKRKTEPHLQVTNFKDGETTSFRRAGPSMDCFLVLLKERIHASSQASAWSTTSSNAIFCRHLPSSHVRSYLSFQRH